MIEWTLPIKLVSEANRKDHWTAKNRRAKIIKNAIKAKWLKEHAIVALPCTITLTRVSPRHLDSDNLQMACKSARDQIADLLIPKSKIELLKLNKSGKLKTCLINFGKSDSDPRLTWIYDQEKGKPKEYALKIKIEPTIQDPLIY